ncbi:hypothetical protein ASF61_16745 [Duganella sp. Leaf126]|uniref:hypothetical protein n=1 Tax=Duganella sp. Leaf126 TaxID=1736266 RepID=UPI0006F6C682|nr:hypothetical protein [Duganella sp. Leaf126]KQQ31983.1 hypothetical protein ASF61_16745 [Duganella sp. Leaf126]
MNNLRIIYDNAIDRAVLTASSQAGGLGPANLQRDERSAVLRAEGTGVAIFATWPTPELIACVAPIRSNMNSSARMRVRGYDRAGDSTPVLDTGVMMPCPEAPLGASPIGYLPPGWNGYQWGGVNTWARGGGSDGVAWFEPVSVRQLVIELSSVDNPDGYIELSRLVAGMYWSPEYNASYGASATSVDTSESYRTAAGAAKNNVGTRHRQLSLNLEFLTGADSARLARIVDECGTVRPLLFSLFPENADPVLEQQHMLYGRIANIEAISAPSFGIYSTPLQIEGF